MAKLTVKQRRFVEEYRIDWNATQAAIRAGYSERTANEQGARLLANVSIQKYLQQLLDGKREQTEVTVDRIIAELATMAFISLDDEKVITGIVKPSDKNKSLEHLGKHLGMFDKRPQDTAQNVNDITTHMLSLAQLLSNPLPNRGLPDDE